MNNARLSTLATYYDLVPHFHRILNEKHHGDLHLFLSEMKTYTPLKPAERVAALHKAK